MILIVSCVRPCHFVFGVVLFGFPWFSSCLILDLSFIVLRDLGICLEKRNVSGAQGDMNEIQQEM